MRKKNRNSLHGITICCFAFLFLCSVSGEAGNAELAMGPYLRFTGPDSAVVKWQTDQPCPSVLLYGEDKPDENRITDPAPKTEHRVAIAGLKPDTVYSYVIETVKDGVKLATTAYECDTFFNYSLPDVPDKDIETTPYSEAAERILKNSGITQGYCLILGIKDGQLAYELARRSNLRIVGVDDDARRVDRVRRKLRDAGIYGSRVTIQHVSSLAELPFTGRFANLIVSEPGAASPKAEVSRLLRPGGVAYLGGAKMIGEPLPGSGRWSHEYGSADNSANSLETLQGATNVKDMAVQWIGLPGPRAQADRNGRKPSPLAINGRLFVQGLHRIVALDAYNGAILWFLEIPDFERFNIPRDCSNWCADNDYVFAAIKGKCWRLDAATGELSRTYDVIPGEREDWKYDWGYIARSGDKLYGSAVKKDTAFVNFWGGSGQGWYDATSGEATYKVCSDNLFALDRNSGEAAWVYRNGLIINSTITVSDNRVYFAESRNEKAKAGDLRRLSGSEFWKDQYLVSLDADTGEKIWEKPIDTARGVVMFHMAYGSDALYLAASGGGKYNLYAYDAATGAEKWNATEDWGSDNHGGHMSRPVIVGNVVYMRPYTFNADTGEKRDIRMPGGGCGTYGATKNAMIFRSGNVTMWDMKSQAITGWHRLRPDCWLSTIPACGLVLSPEAGGGCSCGSWMETSIAFMPIKATRRGGNDE